MNTGTYLIRTPARILEGLLSLTKGDLKEGMKIIEQAQESHRQKERWFVYASAEDLLGRVYFQITERSSTGFSLTRDLGFLIHHVPFASQKAEDHFNQAIRIARKIGARGVLGIALMDLGLLFQSKKKKEKARECLTEATRLFQEGGADGYLRQAEAALRDL